MNTKNKRVRTYERLGQIEDIIRQYCDETEKANPEDFQTPIECFFRKIEGIMQDISRDVDRFQNNPAYKKKDDKKDKYLI